MPREKKVTVVFYLNKDVKPRFSSDGKEKLYPVYCRVTFDRKNTKFKFGNSWTPESYEEDLFQDPQQKAYLERAERSIVDIVRYEEEAFGEKFTLRKLGDRFDLYQEVVLFLLERELSKHLDEFAGQYLVYNDYEKWKELDVKQKMGQLTGIARKSDAGKLPQDLLNEIVTYLAVANYAEGLFNVHEWIMRGVRESLPRQIKQKPLKYAGQQTDPEEVQRAIDRLVNELLEPVYTKHFDVESARLEPQTGKLKVKG